MKKVIFLSLLLIAGLVLSQFLPAYAGDAFGAVSKIITLATLTGLSFIMLQVGLEFEVDKTNLKPFAWDYVVAATAATFPWILVVLYFVFVMLPAGAASNLDAWKETLIAGRFAAPTSAGVLFSMLAAAGLASTWLFRKARVLAIFDDLDTVLLLIPLKMMLVGFSWELGLIIAVMLGQVWFGWTWLRGISLPTSRWWLLGYSVLIVIGCEAIYLASVRFETVIPIHIEVLLPAFILGCVMRHRHPTSAVEVKAEQRFADLVSAGFIFLVGVGMPLVSFSGAGAGEVPVPEEAVAAKLGSVTSSQPDMTVGVIACHVLAITLLCNLGKMFPALCYRREAGWRERLALAIAMWPRGEVGAGILVLSLGYGLGGPVITVAALSLALNLLLTGVFIVMVKRLLPASPPAA